MGTKANKASSMRSAEKDVSQNTRWDVQIYVPQAAGTQPLNDDAVQKHSLPSWLGGSKIDLLDGSTMQSQWTETIDNMLKLTTSIVGGVGDWQLDAMEVGMTLSAKGQLLFIAEAGAQASVKLTLKRK